MNAFLEQFGWLLATVATLLAAFASGHVVLNKRDPRAALAWVGFIWLAPFLGTAFYVWLGVNRLQRRAARRRAHVRPDSGSDDAGPSRDVESVVGHFAPLDRLGEAVTGLPLRPGHTIETLVDGDEAYPSMFAAIDAAERSIAMCTYIFETGPAVRGFVDALARAAARGVEVRVLVDDVGARYSWKRVTTVLREAGVTGATFMPTLAPRWPYGANLRNHRKLLVVDGRVGFAGGMNVRERHLRNAPGGVRVRDVHFRVEGPIVADMLEVFAVDWSFTTGEVLEGDAWSTEPTASGPTWVRAVPDGPDADLDNVERVLIGALAMARESVLVMTPYFLPDAPVAAALGSAALRGVTVDVVLPARNNLPLVQWASMPILPQLVEAGCRVWQSPPPFDHSKLMVVDGLWSKIGSSNWDPRSLRLNFEFDLECYDAELAAGLATLVREQIARSERVTAEWLTTRPLLARLRNGIAHLASPSL